MKRVYKLLTALFMTLVILLGVNNINAANVTNATFRIEGYDKTLLEKTDVQVTPVDISDIAGGKPSEWTKEVPSVTHLVVKTLQDKGYDPKDPKIVNFDYKGNYIDNFFGLETFSTGSLDGWMYTVNNVIAPVGIKEYQLKEGDNVVFYFTTDYTKMKYSSLDKEEVNVNVGEEIKLKNLSAFWDMSGSADVSGIPVEGAYLILEKTVDGKVTTIERKDVVSDKNGDINFKIDEPGTYRALTWFGDNKYSGLSRAYSLITVTKKEEVKPQPTITSKVVKKGNYTYYYSLKGKVWFNNKTILKKGSTTTTYIYKYNKNKVKSNDARPRNGAIISSKQAVTKNKNKVTRRDTVYYNNNELATKRRLVVLNKRNKQITTHAYNRTYHPNKKIKQIYNINRNLNNGSLKNRHKVNFNKKGKKTKNIKLTYKKNKINKRVEYRYNKLGVLKSNKKYGNAYRYTTSYKKGKAKKTIRVKYNNKGKTVQKRIVKLIKSF